MVTETTSLYKRISEGNEGKVYPNYWCVLVAYGIALLAPRNRWYRLAFAATWYSQFVYYRQDKTRRSRALVRASHLNRILALLTRTGHGFLIPFVNKGFSQTAVAGTTIFCTVHLPLVKVAIRAIAEEAVTLDGAIVGFPLQSGQMALWGSTQKVPALDLGPFVLLKAKSILAKKGNIVLMIDNSANDNFSPNILHLCGKVGARVIFFFSELMPDGSIENTFVTPPDPFCKSPEGIEANLICLKQHLNNILDSYKNQ